MFLDASKEGIPLLNVELYKLKFLKNFLEAKISLRRAS